jgi:desampylase
MSQSEVAMPVRISSSLVARLIALAEATPDREVCGLLLGSRDTIEDIRVADNVADQPARRFEVDPATLFATLRAARAGGPALIGNFHSHPSGQPSPSATDAAMIGTPGDLWLIVAAGRVTAWRARADAGFDPETLVLA